MKKTTYRAYISVLKEGVWVDFIHDLVDNGQKSLREAIRELFNLDDCDDYSITLVGTL